MSKEQVDRGAGISYNMLEKKNYQMQYSVVGGDKRRQFTKVGHAEIQRK